jgi:ribosomal protein S18 acetylase RimI-like enzyme
MVRQTGVVVMVRAAEGGDRAFLSAMLVEAVEWRPSSRPRSGEALLATPELAHYVTNWPAPGDFGLIALDPEPVGAVWCRYFGAADPGYGFVNESIPELSIGVVEGARGRGIGTLLLRGLIVEAGRRAIPTISLSVDPENPAGRLYRRLGFEVVGGVGGSHTMVCRTVP